MTELGRATRAIVSGYDRTRIHDSRIIRGEKRTLAASFNGALEKGRTVVSVTWRMQPSLSVAMSNARILTGGREVAVDIQATWYGDTAIKCEATTDTGGVYSQLFRINVIDSPWFDGNNPTAPGPIVLTSP